MSAPQYYLECLRARWSEALVVFLLIFGGVAAWVTLKQDHYTSVAEVQVNAYSPGDKGAAQAGLIVQYDPFATLQSVASIAESQLVLAEVQKSFSEYSLKELNRKITSSPKGQSTLLAISATHKDPEVAQEMAAQTVSALQDVANLERDQKADALLTSLLQTLKRAKSQRLPIQGVSERIDDLVAIKSGESPLVSVVVPAPLPYKADGPSKGLIIAGAAIVAIFFALLTALLLEGPRPKRY